MTYNVGLYDYLLFLYFMAWNGCVCNTEAVKTSVASPTPPMPSPTKPKTSSPALKGNLLPQAVVQY